MCPPGGRALWPRPPLPVELRGSWTLEEEPSTSSTADQICSLTHFFKVCSYVQGSLSKTHNRGLLLTFKGHYQKHTTEVCVNYFKFPRTTAPIARDLKMSLIFCSSGIGQKAQLRALEGHSVSSKCSRRAWDEAVTGGTKEYNIALVARPVADLPPYRPRLSSHCSDWRLISWKLSPPFGGGGGGFKSEVAWKAGLVVAEGTFRGNELEWLLCKDLKKYSIMYRAVPFKWQFFIQMKSDLSPLS